MASSEQRELELVDKVNLRILNVANDAPKLTQLLKPYLPALLLKAGSDHASVRSKVVTICQRLKVFIKSPEVVLPVAALLDQYIANSHPVIRQLDITFIQHSIGRISADERRKLVPAILNGIHVTTHTTPARFNMFLQTLKDINIPPRGSKEDEAFRQEVGLTDSKDAEFTAKWLGKILLTPSPHKKPPGLIDEDMAFLTLGKPDEAKPEGTLVVDWPGTMIKAAKLLESGAFTDEERFMPALYAAASNDYRINSVGNAMLMRNQVSLEDEGRARLLFESHSRLPPTYRIRILNLLSKSALSTTLTQEILNTVRRDIKPKDEAVDGLQLTKLHKALFEYINWVARIGPGKGKFEIGPTLIELLRGFITEEQGWPKPSQEKRALDPLDDRNLRARAYETIGVLARGSSMEQADLLELVAWLFRSLSEDPTPEVVVNIEGALSVMTSIFKPDNGEVNRLRTIILTYMTLSDGGDSVRSVRHAATKWANQCLAFSDPIARWVDILAINGRGEERMEVIEEGRKGLDPWTYRVNDAAVTNDLPDWQQLVQTFFKEPMGYGASAMMSDGPSNSQNFVDLSPSAFPTAVTYCKRMLLLAALKDEFNIEPGWEQQLDTLVKSDKQTRESIRRYLGSLSGHVLESFMEAALEGIQEDKPTTEECARSFVEVASLAPKSELTPLILEGIPRLLAVVTSNKKEVRSLAARALGILVAHPSVSSSLFNVISHVLRQQSQSWRMAVGAEMNAAQGAFVALGHTWSRAVYYPHPIIGADGGGTDSSKVRFDELEEHRRKYSDGEQDASIDSEALLHELRNKYLKANDPPRTTQPKAEEWLPPVEELGGTQLSFQEVIFDTLTQLWTALIVPEEASVTPYIDVLVPQCKKGNERAITALGRLALGLKDGDAALDTILSKLYELHELKQPEVHFAIGEAITAAVARWDSDIVQLTVDVQSKIDKYRVEKRADKVQEVLDKILTDCKATKPSLLKASGIWLFSIIQHCSHLPEIQARLRECQVAFMRLLSARDELVQETASRGLSLVYEKGDPSLKENLVKDLVGAFTGTGAQLKVEEDTELFEAGALPTGEGKSVTSYRDIMNLANEVGDQSLVYKFMSLASNAATWSTRSAFGRFGLSNILSESEVDPKLYPKLFRYRFDPNTNVQRSMNDIWKALVKDSNAVIEEHFDAIMNDLLKSIHTKEWRVRQASCSAIADLISGRPFQRYEKYYGEIWTKALKVLDDVKATVRNEALKLCMGMANTLTRQLEEGGVSASAKDMMSSTLPFLLSDKGIESNVNEVKGFAIDTVIKITKTGGSALRPYIATIVTHLLGLLSTIEPDAINYYYQRFGEDDREKIDKIRSQMVNQSPISQAIENCLRNVDESVMPDLASGLEEAIKSALGMPTKVGYRFLRLLEKQCLDRNDEVSQGYAKAAAYLMRHAPSDVKERFITKFETLYFNAEDEARRQKVADVVLSLSKISPDHFNALEGSLLPFSYLGMHDLDEYVAKAFKEVWETHAGSSRTATRFVPEVEALVQRALDTPQWSLKHGGALTSASAMSAIAAVAGDNPGSSASAAHLARLWPAFDRSLALKTFAGKEKLLDALADVASKGKALWEGDAAVAAQMKKVVLREAKRNNETYRVHAFRCLWRCAAARKDVDLWEEAVAIARPFLEEYANEDRMDVDADSGKAAKEKEVLVYKTALGAVEVVARGYNRPLLKRRPVQVTRGILDVLGSFFAKPRFDSIRREAWYKAVEDLMKDADGAASEEGEADGADAARRYFESLDVDKPDLGVETQRVVRAQATVALAKAVKKGVFGTDASNEGGVVGNLRTVITEARGAERSVDVRRIMDEALAEL
ncbi:putative proteasome component [Diaporthe ampelina]|uniref:Putative proteasome component n=1 Tax=Diaporthe ampelina TaxID=1214573 RepID=A0A0G2FUI4_9PEZI|nr:putative proteasome component [Diaporthe ampelina]